jgi:DNA-binding NarL/FixJ family response regulator
LLIIEDDEVIALALSAALEDHGFEICGIAANRAQALLAVERDRPAIAIVDVKLAQDDDGVRLGSDLAQRYGTIVIYATGNPDEVTRRGAAGLLTVVTKPYSVGAVIEAIHSAQRFAALDF